MKKQLVILPGWNASKDSWQDFINLAQNQYEVICLELPCFGNEPCPEKIWEVADYAEFVKQKIIDLNLARPILLGHSFGGQIAVYLAANNQQLISKLILSGAAIIRPAKNLKRLVFEALAKTGKIIFKGAPAILASESDFKDKLKAYSKLIKTKVIEEALIISASGEKDATWEIVAAKKVGLKTKKKIKN